MNNFLKLALLTAAMLPGTMSAQDVDYTKYPDYSAKINPNPALLHPMRKVGSTGETRPDHVNNADTKFFPPVFNQSGGSCGSASRICYMFTHELNSFRDEDGSDPHHYYPSHFVWLLTNGNSGKDAFVQHVGVPSAATYGGQTYSSLFGYQEETNNDFGWMTGYEKWYEAMFNRMLKPSNFPISVQSEEGREAVKNWLWNHNGDTDFKAGGICGIGVASGGDWQKIASTPTNDEIGVTNMYYVKAWGKSVDHALTIVGYDDRIEFDLDGDGVYGEEDADEKGAWIIVNSWGSGWCNGGFIYCPYANAGPSFAEGATKPGSYYQPEIYSVRKNYVPKRTIKIEMDYSRRSELYLSAGVSDNLNATTPDYSQAFDHFKYAGDGANGDTKPAPEIPMLGRWADGKLHTEPMEFGYDLTDLTANYDKNKPLKYFFIIQTKSGALGSGHVYNASIIDYAQDELGVETKFDTGANGVEIKNNGEQTIISVIVQGEGLYAPQNLAINDGKLQWNAPIRSGNTLTGYNVYQSGNLVATTSSSETSYALTDGGGVSYGVSALYGDKESEQTSIVSPSTATDNEVVNFQKSGFSIPDVFGTKYDQATIEYWINCNSLTNWNQSGGPGWGTFMFHANSDASFTAGWDTSNRGSASGALSKGVWRHIAIVVDNNTMTLYVNGAKKKTITSSSYSGIGGFGALDFSNSSSNNSYQDARYDEIRIWKTARTAAEIKASYKQEFGDAGLPSDLMAYFKGDLVTIDGVTMLRDHTAGQHHATILDDNFTAETFKNKPALTVPTDLSVSINAVEGVTAGVPVTLSANASTAAQSLAWTIEGADIATSSALTPTVSFSKAGTYAVKVVATDKSGNTSEATLDVTVQSASKPDASFTSSSALIAAGERVTFLASNPQLGYTYKWEMPGANTETASSANAATSYDLKGTYTVRLTVTNGVGESASSEQKINVTEVAPEAGLTVSPAVVVKGETVVLTDKSKYGPTKWAWGVVSDENAYTSEKQNVGFVADRPGVYDVTLSVANGEGQNSETLERGLIVCNADSKNGLNFSYDAARVTLSKAPLAADCKEFTIDWWMRPGRLASTGNAIGQSKETLYLYTTSTGVMTVYVGGRTVSSGAGFVIAQQWHHYAVTLKSGSVRFYRDGKQVSSASIGSSVKVGTLSAFTFGADNAPLSGSLDEFRIWNKSLTAAQIKSYNNQPITDVTAEEANGLVLYYQFNQSSGDVKDATSNANNGTRSGFGPEGDAWGLSQGVFCLNYEDATSDQTRRLKNYKSAFAYDSNSQTNTSTTKRFYTITSWTVENVTDGNQQTGVCVDKSSSNDMAFITTSYGFDDKLTDHKVYQTVTLPAGTYAFTAKYGSYSGDGEGSYLVVAEGDGLPSTANVLSGSIAFKALESKSDDVTENTVTFTLSEETEVSLGLLVNMSESSALYIHEFQLVKYPTADMQEATGINDVEIDTVGGSKNLYDLMGRRVINPVKGNIYIKDGKKIFMK